ncbi:MAG: hypothetical protein R3F59_12055 [Myxococcota bacterium]
MSVHPLRAIGRGLRTAVAVIIEVFHEFVRDECVPLAGSLAFFTLFSFGPILALVVDIASVAVEPGIIRAELVSSIGAMFGTPVAEQTRVALEQLRERQLDSHPWRGSRAWRCCCSRRPWCSRRRSRRSTASGRWSGARASAASCSSGSSRWA